MKNFNRPDHKLREFAKNPRWLQITQTISNALLAQARNITEVEFFIENSLRDKIGRAVADEAVTNGLIAIENNIDGTHFRFNAVFMTYDELMDALNAAYTAGRLEDRYKID